MGVPAFFRWLCNSCPQVVQPAVYEQNENGESKSMPRIDNLYLDMNGIIHPCTHPPPNCGVPPPKSEEDMFENIRRYVNLIIQIIRPQELIYFSIDGVAPKAKMNQQRTRRFRAAQEIKQGLNRKRTVAENLRDRGVNVPETLLKDTHWDHNVITPGTEFMERVSNMLKAFIVDSLCNDPVWSGLKVIFSDANVPMEGEHKILEHVRIQRLQPGYNPNTRLNNQSLYLWR